MAFIAQKYLPVGSLFPGSASELTEPDFTMPTGLLGHEETKKGKRPEPDPVREEQLERWMNSVKLFIRNIDVNSL